MDLLDFVLYLILYLVTAPIYIGIGGGIGWVVGYVLAGKEATVLGVNVGLLCGFAVSIFGMICVFMSRREQKRRKEAVK